ncbi:MAG: hypothetical protein OSJ73_16445 [Lachnospiraceae bacterium]|nr:hypothetical protein [Lachnospiraceae bacterium]
MEEVITDKKQEISTDVKISLDDIYNAIKCLKPEHQASILANYKMLELYNIFENNETYNKYIKDLFVVAIEYNDRAIALSALHTEAFLQSIKKDEVLDGADLMCQMYDCIPEEDRKRFCESMLQKRDFCEIINSQQGKN